MPPGIHFTAESTDAMRIKCLDQGRKILIPGFELSASVSRNVHPSRTTSVLQPLRHFQPFVMFPSRRPPGQRCLPSIISVRPFLLLCTVASLPPCTLSQVMMWRSRHRSLNSHLSPIVFLLDPLPLPRSVSLA